MQEVTLDVLPLKRVLALEEAGTELYPPEPSIEEKPLSLLRCLDFDRHPEKKKEAKKPRKDGPQQGWPWHALLEHFQNAREELITLQDFIANIEANETLSVQHMMKPKLLPNEICADLALRFSSKSRNYQDVGKYLKRSAKAMERQAERESVFYEALMRLQCNWKIKRQRVVAAGPGSKAGFIIDLAFPHSLDSNLITSPRTAPSIEIKVDQDSNGLLTVELPPGKAITCLRLQLLEGAYNKQAAWQQQYPEQKYDEKMHLSGDASDEGALSANLKLRRLQTSNIDELVFDCLCREALQPSTSTSLIGIGDTSLQVSVGDSLAAMFRLFKGSGSESSPVEKNSGEKLTLNTQSSRIFINQTFFSILRLPHSKYPAAAGSKPGAVTSNESPGSLLRQFSIVVCHRLASSRITSLLDKLVLEVPQLWFLSHPTWKPFVSAWDVYFDVPRAITRGGQLKHQDWSSLTRPSSRGSTFQCTLVLRQESLRVEGLDGFVPLPKHSGQESTEMTSCSCSISGLALFLLSQIAGKILKWLEEEAALLGTRVRRNFLSIIFDIENGGHISLVAAPGNSCINWWLRFYNSSSSSGVEEAPAAFSVKEKWIESTTPTSEKFLGPLGLETLRAIVMDLLSFVKESE